MNTVFVIQTQESILGFIESLKALTDFLDKFSFKSISMDNSKLIDKLVKEYYRTSEENEKRLRVFFDYGTTFDNRKLEISVRKVTEINVDKLKI